MDIGSIGKVCVAGAGRMGRQIALCIALHGFEVALTDSSPEVLEQVGGWSRSYLAGRVAKQKIGEEEAAAVQARFHLSKSLAEAAKGAGLAIEAVIEERSAKEHFYRQLGAVISPEAVVASNSSYMPSSLFRDCLERPERLANMHFFNPALVLKLVEVVSGPHTAEATAQFIADFARAIGKVPIRVNREIDGFVVNRILRAIRDEAYALVEGGVCSFEDLDTGVELGLNHPMGPFRLLDLTGIDLNYLSMERRREETGVKPAGYDIAREKYEAGQWGKKAGRGFYVYDEG